MDSITHISYLISSIAFLLLAIFYNQRQINIPLKAFIIALLGNALWSSIRLSPLNDFFIYGQIIPELIRSAYGITF